MFDSRCTLGGRVRRNRVRSVVANLGASSVVRILTF